MTSLGASLTTMRARLFFFGSVLVASIACGHEDHRPVAHPQTPQTSVSTQSQPSQYVVADPGGGARNMIVTALGSNGQVGVVVDKVRILAGRGEPRVAKDVTEAAINGVEKIPTRFGGGFLFWSDATLYRTDAFDGELRPFVKMPDSVQNISFAAKFVLVRTTAGERYALSLPSGQRVAIEPLGVADVQTLDDGRGIAFNDQSTVFTTTDAGAHWTDVTTLVRSAPQKIQRIDDELWLIETSGGAQRIEADGHLAYFDRAPIEKPAEVRMRDPKWRSNDSPLREAFRVGAAIDDGTALVISDGDLVRVDVRTGEIVSTQQGKLPPDARCEAVSTSNDVLFACTQRSYQSGYAQGSAFVVSHTLGDEPPTVERTFNGMAPFFGSDDGGLAYSGPCAGISAGLPPGTPTPATNLHAVCVRQPGGTWQEQDTGGYTSDGGAGDLNVVRWIPRADGRVVALVSDPSPGIFDPASSQLVALPAEARDVVVGGLGRYPRYGGKRGGYYYYNGQEIVDWSWSFNATGALRGWQRQGGIVEVGEDGKVTRSPYTFEIVASGPYAIGKSPGGRMFQSTDHGTSWTEIAAPPSGGAAMELVSCSSAGCDLGGFYRVGWTPRAPKEVTPPVVAKLAPEVRRQRGVDIACRPAGSISSKSIPRDEHSPDNLGLGLVKLPISSEDGTTTQMRLPTARFMTNPIHPPMNGNGDVGENPSLRALFSGYQTQRDSDVITVMGPNKQASQLRRAIAFVPGFDPSASVKRSTIAFSEVLTAGRNAGMSTDEILQDDPTEGGSFLPITPHDPNAASDIVFQHPRGMIALLRNNERVRVAWRQSQQAQQGEASLISGVSTSADEVAFLETEMTGVAHVYKLGAGGITDVFDMFPTASDGTYYPSNPDALAINSKGDLGLLRLASGSDPASDLDPAIIVQPALPALKLAPWSTLVLGDDASCKNDPGWRATVQVIAPWVRASSPELRADDAPMFARVKWTEKHVCLEGIELKLANAPIRLEYKYEGGSNQQQQQVSTWLVGRNGTFARVGIAEGIEWRQPMTCSIAGAPATSP